MKKRLLSLALALVMCLSLLPPPAYAAGHPYLKFYPIDETTCSVDGVHGDLPEQVVIPAEFEGRKVTEIRQNAFSNQPSFTSVEIPNTIQRIGDSAFQNCTALSSVTVPDSVTHLGKSAFQGCAALNRVTLGSGLRSSGVDIFTDTPWFNDRSDGIIYSGDCLVGVHGTQALGDLNVLPGTTHILGGAFKRTSLTSVTLPSSLTSMGDSAFSNCDQLTAVHGLEYVEEFGTHALSSCDALQSVTLSCRTVSDGMFSNCDVLSDVHLQEGVEIIGDQAFGYCKSLTEIALPDSLTTLGFRAFGMCLDLRHVTMGSQIESVGVDVFYNCPCLDRSQGGPIYFNNILWEFAGDVPANYTLEIRPGTRVIADQLFYSSYVGTPNLVGVKVPGSVRRISYSAFHDCPDLVSVTLGEGVESIATSAFHNCRQLKNLQLPDSLKTIHERAFEKCASLTGLTFGSSLEEIGEYAFSDCSSLTQLMFGPRLKQLGMAAFNFCEGVTHVRFTGPAPDCEDGDVPFRTVTADAEYPALDPTWTEEARLKLDNGYSMNWIPVVPADALTPPENMKITVDLNPLRARVRWDGVFGAVSYRVYRSYTDAGSLSYQQMEETTNFNFTDNSLERGRSYRYYVKAVNNTGEEGPASAAVSCTVPLAAPNVRVQLNDSGRPVISWDAVEGAVGYSVQYSLDQGPYQKLSDVNATSLTHTDAAPGRYRYQVRALAKTEAASSPWSSAASIRVRQPLPAETLPAPTVSVSLNQDDKPVLTWNAINGAAKYEIRAKENNGSFQPLTTVTGTTLRHGSATPGSTYTYQVRAIASTAEASSDWSATVSIAVPQPPKPVEKLPAPTVSVSLNQDDKPVLTWNRIDGAVKYEVRYSYNNGSSATLPAVTSTTLTHTDAAPGSFKYQVRAIASTSEANSDWSRSVTITVPKPAEPPKPTQLPAPELHASADPDSGKPILTWNAVEGAAKYEIYRQEDSQGEFEYFYTAKGTSDSLRHGSAVPGSTNGYQIRAIAADGTKGAWSYTVYCSCFLARPHVTVSARTDGKPVLTWDKVDDATSYLVYYSTNGSDFQKLTTAKGTKLNHTSAKPGNTYTYKVQALTGQGYGDSEWSDEVSFTVEEQSLTAPTLTATNKRTTGKPYLKWNKVDGAEKYEVYRATSKSGTYTRLWSGSGTALTNGSAKAGTTYYYKVRAVAADGTQGPWSEIRTRTCDLAQPDVKLTTRSDGKPVLTWQKVSGAVKYEVYRRTDGGDFVRLSTVSGTKLTNSSAKPGHTYTYKVRAIAKKSAANSSYSYYDTVKVK